MTSKRSRLALAAAATACLMLSAPVAAAIVRPPPQSLNLDPFYRKYVDAGGIAIVGSRKAPDKALLIARDIVEAQLAHRPDIRRELVRQGARVGVMAPQESTTDLPEHRGWKKPRRDDPRLTACERDQYPEKIGSLTDRQYWDSRARGTGGTFTTVGAENLLALPRTRFYGENILVHEFSHAIFSALERVDPELHARVRSAYDQAISRGLWKGDYAAVTLHEYWAEGTQFWFNSNMISRLDDGTILSADDLKRYDPPLYSALEQVYGPRHRASGDLFYMHSARLNVPPGRKSADC